MIGRVVPRQRRSAPDCGCWEAGVVTVGVDVMTLLGKCWYYSGQERALERGGRITSGRD